MRGWMGVYRAVWVTAACCVGGLGAAVGLANHHAREVGGLVSLAAIISGAASYLTHARRPVSGKICQCITTGVVGGAGCFAVTGLGTVLGPVALLIALLFAVTSPPAMRCYHAPRRRKASIQLPAPPAPPAPTVIKQVAASPAEPTPRFVAASMHSLTVAELCLAWRRSFIALQRIQRGHDIARQARLVSVRQGYLDELERRDPAGFQRWLYAGARPASDPSRYVKSATDSARTKKVESEVDISEGFG